MLEALKRSVSMYFHSPATPARVLLWALLIVAVGTTKVVCTEEQEQLTQSGIQSRLPLPAEGSPPQQQQGMPHAMPRPVAVPPGNQCTVRCTVFAVSNMTSKYPSKGKPQLNSNFKRSISHLGPSSRSPCRRHHLRMHG